MSNKENQQGFTLVETMVTVVIFTAMMSLGMAIFLGSVRTQRFALYQQRVTTETSYALNRAEQELKKGETVDETFIRELLPDMDSFRLTNFNKIENGKRVTLLIETEMDVEEEKAVEIRLQTTVLIGE